MFSISDATLSLTVLFSFADNLPVPWYWLVFAGAMISSAGILIYRRNTKVYKD